MATNYVKLHEKQIDKLIEQNEALHQEMKEMKDYFKETINSLKDELKKSNEARPASFNSSMVASFIN